MTAQKLFSCASSGRLLDESCDLKRSCVHRHGVLSCASCRFGREPATPSRLEQRQRMADDRRMKAASRPQRRYDHRLRDLVRRAGDVTIATDLGVPRSTARGWLAAASTVVITVD